MKLELEKSDEGRKCAEEQRDNAVSRLECTEEGFKVSLSALDGTVSGDVVEMIESVNEKWRGQLESMQGEHQQAMESAKQKFEQQLVAYKTAASNARQEEDIAIGELEKTQASHLETLNDLKVISEKLKSLERDSGGRIAELLDELNASQSQLEDMEGSLEKQDKMYTSKINELVARLDELESANARRKSDMSNMVSREAVLEMESLFTETIEKLVERVNCLEGKSKENQLDREIMGVNQNIQQSRAANLDPQAKQLLEQMERNSGQNSFGISGNGRGQAQKQQQQSAMIAPGRLRVRKQAF